MIDKSKSGYIAERPRIGAGALVSSLARYPSRRCFSSVLLGGSLRRLDALGRAFGRLLGVVASRRCALGVGSSLIGSGHGSIFGTFSALIDALSHGLLALGACVGLLAGALAFDSALVKNDGVAISVNRRHARAVLGAFLLG